jgi:hypothetical protein
VKCQDSKGRVLIIEQLTGATGGTPGSYLASVDGAGKEYEIPRPVMKDHMDVTFPIKYQGKGILVEIPNIQLSDIPVTQARGTLKIKGDAKPVEMLCNKGPAYNK